MRGAMLIYAFGVYLLTLLLLIFFRGTTHQKGVSSFSRGGDAGGREDVLTDIGACHVLLFSCCLSLSAQGGQLACQMEP